MQTDTMSWRTRARPAPAAEGRGTRRYRLRIHDDHHSWWTNVAAEDMDVRTSLVLGQKQEDWRIRPNEDACDSLDLGDEGLAEGLDHHTQLPHTGLPCHTLEAGLDSSDRAASGPVVAHAPHRSLVDLEVGRSVVHQDVLVFFRYCGDEGMQYARARKRVLATRRG